MKTLLALLIFLGTYSDLHFGTQNSIIGTWVSVDDPNWKRVFKTDGKCYEYYNGLLQDTYTYFTKKSGNLCSKYISEKPNISYIELTNISNNQDKYCYEIASLSDNYLQLIYFENGKSQRFKKQ